MLSLHRDISLISGTKSFNPFGFTEYMEFGSIKNQVDPHCVFTRSETGPELRVAVLVAVKIEESTKTELLSISGPLIVLGTVPIMESYQSHLV